MQLSFGLIVLAVLVSLIFEIKLFILLTISKLKKQMYFLFQPKRLAKLQRAWPEFMDDLASGVRSGLPLEQAVIEAANRTPLVLKKIMSELTLSLRSGNSLLAALDQLLQQPVDAVGRRLIVALKIASVAGGKDVVTTLQTLADSVRRDLQLLDQLRAKQRSAISGARVAVLAPWLVIGLTSLQPSVRIAYQSGTGIVLLIFVILISLLAYFWMLRVSKLRIGDLR